MSSESDRERRKFYRLELALSKILYPLRHHHLSNACIKQFALELASSERNLLVSRIDGKKLLEFRASSKWLKKFRIYWNFPVNANATFLRSLLPKVKLTRLTTMQSTAHLHVSSRSGHVAKNEVIVKNKTGKTLESSCSKISVEPTRTPMLPICAVAPGCSDVIIIEDKDKRQCMMPHCVKADKDLEDIEDMLIFSEGLLNVDELLGEFNNDQAFFDSIVADLKNKKLKNVGRGRTRLN